MSHTSGDLRSGSALPSRSRRAVSTTDALQISAVLQQYGQAIDNADWELLASTLDESFVLQAGEQEFHGLDALQRSVEATRPLPAHHVDPGQMLQMAPGVVRVWSRFTAVTDEGLARAGDYVDVLVHRDDGWRLTHREVWRRYSVPSDPSGSSRAVLTQERFETAPLPPRVPGWATPTVPDPADQFAILRTLHLYAVAVDERRWDVWQEIFTPDAVLDFSVSSWGPSPHDTWGDGSPGTVRAVLEANDALRISGQHLLFNSLVDVLGDRAEVRSEYTAHTLARTADPQVAVKVDTGGVYEDVLRRVQNRWLIERRRSTVLWQTRTDLALPANRR